MKKTIVIIPAGGKGTRFDSTLPKQYHLLSDIPIIIRTISKFNDCSKIEKIVLNIDKSYIDFVQQECKKIYINPDKLEILTQPGKERQDTVLNALNSSQAVENADIILVHDAVRCLVDTTLISAIINEAALSHAVCPGILPKNTIKAVDETNFVQTTYQRSRLREIQTPQGFEKNLLIKAYQQADEEKFIGTDSASLVERIGEKVKVILGNEQNFKITTPLDFKLAELLISQANQ